MPSRTTCATSQIQPESTAASRNMTQTQAFAGSWDAGANGGPVETLGADGWQASSLHPPGLLERSSCAASARLTAPARRRRRPQQSWRSHSRAAVGCDPAQRPTPRCTPGRCTRQLRATPACIGQSSQHENDRAPKLHACETGWNTRDRGRYSGQSPAPRFLAIAHAGLPTQQYSSVLGLSC